MKNRSHVAWLCALLIALPVYGETITCRVVAVTGGDTVTVLDPDQVPHKIRLAGIDATEKGQAFSNVSRLVGR